MAEAITNLNRRRVVRLGVTAALISIVAVTVLANDAYAVGKPAVATLACANGENGNATVQLQSSVGGSAASNPAAIRCSQARSLLSRSIRRHDRQRASPFGQRLSASPARCAMISAA